MTDRWDQLAALEQAASKAPWGAPNPTWPEKAMPILDGQVNAVALAWSGDFEQRKADAAFIAEMRNAIPDLLRERAELLRELLNQWEQNHVEWCTNMPHSAGDTCHWPKPSILTMPSWFDIPAGNRTPAP